ncbi:hypothetical protein EG329_013615 [Mollisiaceae sp. DMI_Dod_QoI]|nr:hypothetical protein EG329_013615 [Helotiales sp. DMI_Dod_QoI]
MAKQVWADQPFALISTPSGSTISGLSFGTIKIATEMCLAHNSILRNLNAIYLQAPNVTSSKDISNFIIFCQTWHETIHHHHDFEEKIFFPSIEEFSGEKGIMDGNVKQHEAFHDGLAEFGQFLTGLKAEEWDAKKLLQIIDGFGEALTLHLREEIDSLLALEKYGGKNLEKAWADLEVRMRAEVTDMSRVIPLAFGGIDRTFEDGRHKNWPPFPWFVPYLCMLFMWKYRGTWKFSPCTLFGKPRDMPFVKPEQ